MYAPLSCLLLSRIQIMTIACPPFACSHTSIGKHASSAPLFQVTVSKSFPGPSDVPPAFVSDTTHPYLHGIKFKAKVLHASPPSCRSPEFEIRHVHVLSSACSRFISTTNMIPKLHKSCSISPNWVVEDSWVWKFYPAR
jgi:hypothetical protein